MSDKRTGQPGEHLVDQSFDGYLDDDLITEEEEKYYSADVDPEEMRAFRESQQNQKGRGGKEDQAGKAESGPHSGGTQGWQAQDSGMTGAGMQRARSMRTIRRSMHGLMMRCRAVRREEEESAGRAACFLQR